MCLLVKPGTPANIPTSILSEIRYNCRKCGSNKPPRTHHCSICNDCILQMDRNFLIMQIIVLGSVLAWVITIEGILSIS